MSKLDRLIKDAHAFADKQLAKTEGIISGFRRRLVAYMDQGDYRLKNKHICIGLAFILMLCVAFFNM